MSLHVYKAVDVSVGAAIWKRLDNLQNGVKNGAPAVTDDSAAGYEQGSQIFDTSHTPYWIWECQNPAAGAAVWVQVYPGGGGATGPTGPAGTNGRDGRDGLDGEDGQDGLPGNAGATGATGPVGPQGTAGRDGLDGEDGLDGAPGIQGNTGATGATGSTGATGAIGPQGSAGRDGLDGDDGLDGAPGIQGNTGLQGSIGPQGPAGRDGLDGEDGLDGAPGIQGGTGATGAAGAAGSIGPQGPAGRDGIDGDDGLDGAQGIQGNVGSIGPQGPAGRDGLDGDDGLDGSPGIQGAAGAAGAVGATGATGAAGGAGPAGTNGLDGEDGQDGAPGPMWNPGLPAANLVFASNYPSAPGFRKLTTSDMPLAGYILGFSLWFTSSSVITVSPNVNISSVCTAANSSTIIDFSSQVGTITVTTDASIAGNDSFTGPGTVTVANAATAVTGTSTTFLTSFGTRLLGTVSSSAAVVTGVGTTFLSTLAIGDLLGNTTSGYFQVIAIASDTSCTISATPGTPFSSSTVNVIDNPTIKINTNTVSQVKAIADNTHLTLSTNSSAAQTGQAYTIGNVPNLCTMPAVGASWMFVWVGVGATGTGVYVSTQRTTPFGITGYNVSYRRIGSIPIALGLVVAFSQYGTSNDRFYELENPSTNQILATGTATTMTDVVCSKFAPPTANSVFVASTSSASIALKLGMRNAAFSTTASRGWNVTFNGAMGMPPALIPCDGAQVIWYGTSSSGANNVNLFVAGYGECL